MCFSLGYFRGLLGKTRDKTVIKTAIKLSNFNDRAWKTILTQLGLYEKDGRKMTLYSTRRTWITAQVVAGNSSDSLAETWHERIAAWAGNSAQVIENFGTGTECFDGFVSGDWGTDPLAEIDRRLDEWQRLTEQEQAVAVAVHAIPSDVEKLSRYERYILKGLREALEQLERLQERKNQGSMGSFGQNSD